MRPGALIGSIVDGDALLDVLWISALAGVGVTAAFGFAILGATRAVDAGRSGRPVEAALYGALGAAALGAVVAAVVFGIVVMVRKD